MLMREDQGCFDRLQERVNFYMTKNFTFKLRCLYVRQMRADSARLLSNIKSAMIPLNAGGKEKRFVQYKHFRGTRGSFRILFFFQCSAFSSPSGR